MKQKNVVFVGMVCLGMGGNALFGQVNSSERASFEYMRSMSQDWFVNNQEWSDRWHVSVGPVARFGMKIDGIQGGLFGEQDTGSVSGAEYDPLHPGTTKNWSGAVGIRPGVVNPDTGGDMYSLTYLQTSVENDSSNASAMGAEASLSYDMFCWEDCRIGFRFSMAGYFGISVDSDAVQRQYTHHFDQTVVTPPVSIDGVSTSPVNIAPSDIAGAGFTKVSVKGNLGQIGLGPEIIVSDPDFWAYLVVNPELTLTMAQLQMDVEQSAGASESESSSEMLFGAGLTVSAVADISDSLAAALSLGYQYVPPTTLGGNVTADVDFSAVTVGAKLIYTF